MGEPRREMRRLRVDTQNDTERRTRPFTCGVQILTARFRVVTNAHRARWSFVGLPDWSIVVIFMDLVVIFS
jgi:hypothetical protein